MGCVIVHGVVYFLIDFLYSGTMIIEPGSIALFSLETEEWMGTI
jgi:hypothetical protein